MIRVIALILCAARQPPAGCPTLPAGHCGEALPAPWCCPWSRSARSSRPRGAARRADSRPRGAADGAAGRSTPGRLPHAPGRSLGEALPAPWCCRSRSAPRSRPRGAADVLRCRPVADVLPVVLPAGHSGKRCRPVVLPGQDRPHAPGPWCCRRAALPAGCRRAARGAAGPSTPGRLPHAPGRSLGEALPAPWCCPVKIGPTLPAPWCCPTCCAPGPVVLPTCCAPGRLPTCCPWCCRPVNSRPVAPRSRPVVLPDVLRCRPVADVLPVVLRCRSTPGRLPHAPGRSLGEALPAPWCCPVKIGPTLPAPWCCRRAALPAGCRRAARGAALPVNSRPVAPRSRPVTRGSVAGPVVLPGQDRPHAPGPVVLPTCCAAGRLPTCCPWCCRPVNSRPLPHAPGRSLGEALPAPWCCPVKIGPTLPARGAADVLRLPAGCRRAARGAALPVNSRPVAPRSRPPWCCRRAAHIACAGRSDFAGCAGAILGSLTVLRGSPEKPCAGFSPGKHLREFGQLRPADRNQ